MTRRAKRYFLKKKAHKKWVEENMRFELCWDAETKILYYSLRLEWDILV